MDENGENEEMNRFFPVGTSFQIPDKSSNSCFFRQKFEFSEKRLNRPTLKVFEKQREGETFERYRAIDRFGLKAGESEILAFLAIWWKMKQIEETAEN